MNSPDALHCSGCGTQLGLEPITHQSGLLCPACRVPFDQYSGESGLLFDCARCGGQFVQHALLKDLLKRQQVYVWEAHRRADQISLREPVVYRPCPRCQTMMNRKNFGKSSGVIIDMCTRHGVWFDAGELPRVIQFVRSGGLVRTQQRQQEERKQAARQAAAALEQPGRLRPTSFEFEPSPGLLGGLADAVRELLEYLAGR
jgi:Zn-finger nucleic acid-binding protein